MARASRWRRTVGTIRPPAAAPPINDWRLAKLDSPTVRFDSRPKPRRQTNMESYDDLKDFEAHSAAPLPVTSDHGYVEHDGARIWYGTYGSGPPVILLHGGLGHSGNWGYQVPALVRSGYRAVLLDSRGHGRSTRDRLCMSRWPPTLRR